MKQPKHFQVIFWGLDEVLIQQEAHRLNPVQNRNRLALLRQSALSSGQEGLCRLAAAEEQVNEEVMHFIRSLRGEIRMVLLANARRSMRLELEKRWKIAADFDDVLLSAECGMALPDVRFLRAALRRADALPGEAILVDACHENVRMAQALGIFGIWHRSSEEALARVADLLGRPAGVFLQSSAILEKVNLSKEYVLA